jgi:two-component system chemotaxis response regulator CheB
MSDPLTQARNIVVVGASAGGVAALQQIVRTLPSDFPAAVFVVLHIPRDVPSDLGRLLSRETGLPVVTARDCDAIEQGKVYVAPPDRHMTLEKDRVRVQFGPLQNRNRPSIDVLFRSAAVEFGPRVIGVVLTGFLSDGTAGLLAIKQCGGLTVVQDPDSALFPDMPQSALRAVEIDRCAPLSQLSSLLASLVGPMPEDQPAPLSTEQALVHRFEADADLGNVSQLDKVAKPSSFVCPDCGGGLWEIDEGGLPRFRCRVGHGYSAETLITETDAAVENALFAAARSLEDRAALAQRLAENWRDRKAPAVLEHFLQQARQSSEHASTLRSILGLPATAKAS